MIQLLRGRWFYVLLGAVVLLAYGRIFMLMPHHLPADTDEPALATAAPASHASTIELDPRQLLEASAHHPVVARIVGWLLLVVCGLGVGGVVLSVRALWSGRLNMLWRYRSKLPQSWTMNELSHIVLLMMLMVGLAPFVHLSFLAWGIASPTDKHLWSVVFMLGLEGLFVLIVWGFLSTKRLTWSSAFGLSWRKAPEALTQGLVGYTAMFPWVMGLLWLLARLCQSVGIEPPAEPIHELLFLEPRPLVVGLTVLLACLVGPIAEELLFRGIVFSALRTRTSRWWAMGISGSLFAIVHTNPVGFLPILLLGCLLADVYERTGSLLTCITVHVLHNTLLIGLGLAMKQLLTA